MDGHHPAIEEYTEAIFGLREDGFEVIQARIAERLDVSRPAVSEMVRRLERDGIVHTTGHTISLTSTGEEIAERTVRRHRLAECFLTEMLGLSWTAAHEEAGRWEHVISDNVEAAMVRVLRQPTTCPHGNPIPGSSYQAPNTTELSKLEVGISFTVSRIPEELEFVDGLLAFLEQSGLTPGTKGQITAASPDGTTTVKIGDRTVGIGSFACERILVIT